MNHKIKKHGLVLAEKRKKGRPKKEEGKINYKFHLAENASLENLKFVDTVNYIEKLGFDKNIPRVPKIPDSTSNINEDSMEISYDVISIRSKRSRKNGKIKPDRGKLFLNVKGNKLNPEDLNKEKEKLLDFNIISRNLASKSRISQSGTKTDRQGSTTTKKKNIKRKKIKEDIKLHNIDCESVREYREEDKSTGIYDCNSNTGVTNIDSNYENFFFQKLRPKKVRDVFSINDDSELDQSQVVKAFEIAFIEFRYTLFAELDDYKEHSFFRKLSLIDNLIIHSDERLDAPSDDVLICFLNDVKAKTNFEYLILIIKVIVLLREFLNSKIYGFSDEKPAALIPEYFNDFVVELLEPQNYFLMNENEIFELLGYIADWLFYNGFSTIKLRTVNSG